MLKTFLSNGALLGGMVKLGGLEDVDVGNLMVFVDGKKQENF